MTINASCSCGKTFRVKDELAGKKVKCSACGQPFTVPAPSNASPSSVAGPVTSCACGAQFRVTAKIAGKKVRCPKCKTICQMPAMSAAAGAGAAQAVVAEVAAPVDEDFWAGVSPPQPATEEGDNLFPQEPTSPKDDMSSSQASGYVIRQIHKGKTNEEIEEDLIGKGMKPYDAARLLETLAEGMRGEKKECSLVFFLLFSWDGEIPRSQYWLGCGIIYALQIAWMAGVLALGFGMIGAGPGATYGFDIMFWCINIPICILFWFMSVSVVLKRLNDLDMDWTWILMPIIPIVGGFIGLYLFIKLGFIRGVT
ncbi:MAG TPA: DUF805 domain-containing protein [Planctomycetes bacterium]|nr:DUF805 domain-containing protein [Planctomycetaceae bacterium]HIM30374.1 DUF805 domain-containing protein [Planctomycetota bacterium]